MIQYKRKFVVVLFMAIFGRIFLAGAQSPPTDADCVDDTPFADPLNCTTYYQCFDLGGGAWTVVHLDCPPGGYYDTIGEACVEGTCINPTTTTTEDSIEDTSSSTTEATTETTTGPSSDSTTASSTASSTEGSTSTTELSSTSTEEPSTQGPPEFKCTAAGFFAHLTDPGQYYRCIFIQGRFYLFTYACPPLSCFQQGEALCVVGSCAPPPTMPTPTTAPPAVTTLATTSPPASTPAPDYPCVAEGFFPDPTDCQAYYRCLLSGGMMYRYMYRCPVTTYWDNAQSGCIIGPCPNPPTTTTTATQATTAVTETSTEAVSTGSSADTTVEVTTSGGTSPPPFTCTAVGTFSDPGKCMSYNRCMDVRGTLYLFTFTCPAGFKFDLGTLLCIPGTC